MLEMGWAITCGDAVGCALWGCFGGGQWMFEDAKRFNGNISEWDVSKVRTMEVSAYHPTRLMPLGKRFE